MIKRCAIRITKNILPKRVIDKSIKPLYAKYKYKDIYSELSANINSQRIVIFCIPESGNIGDQAIIIAESRFFQDYLYDLKVIKIPDALYKFGKSSLVKLINKNDIIAIHGGGFLGTLWRSSEMEVRDIIKTFPDNKIIIFPQTVFFENTPYGEKELLTTKKIWQNHKNLTVCLREQNSYNFVHNRMVGGYFKNALLIPDMVLYLNKISSNKQRYGILFCFRKDKEKVFDDNEYTKLHDYITTNCLEKISYTDTVIDKVVTSKDRNVEVKRKLSQFKHSKLVITDRLHGMIFAAITSTPCIAVNNVSKKVQGVYEWIKDLEYIAFVEDASDAYMHIDRLLDIGKHKYTNEHLKPYFDQLANALISPLREQNKEV